MKFQCLKKIALVLSITSLFYSCKTENKNENGKLNIVTTTSMITDLLNNISGDIVNLQGLMGSGVDPHLYKASEGMLLNWPMPILSFTMVFT